MDGENAIRGGGGGGEFSALTTQLIVRLEIVNLIVEWKMCGLLKSVDDPFFPLTQKYTENPL